MAATNGPAHGRRGGAPQEGDRSPADRRSPSPLAPLAACRALAFWAAVVLPFLHVPLLTTGLASAGERHAFLALLALNAAALYLGHGYEPD